jgi:hypothetical protein
LVAVHDTVMKAGLEMDDLLSVSFIVACCSAICASFTKMVAVEVIEPPGPSAVRV